MGLEGMREKLYRYISVFGISDKRTIEVSQELDLLIYENLIADK
ncbi:aspartyl-phosphate phosphatase Spo0E family protein [Clostridium butyricum]|nr:aspartyl-phosphate phosphatase Spo0E family protein [Clostridium butyricum]